MYFIPFFFFCFFFANNHIRRFSFFCSVESFFLASVLFFPHHSLNIICIIIYKLCQRRLISILIMFLSWSFSFGIFFFFLYSLLLSLFYCLFIARYREFIHKLRNAFSLFCFCFLLFAVFFLYVNEKCVFHRFQWIFRFILIIMCEYFNFWKYYILSFYFTVLFEEKRLLSMIIMQTHR